MLLTGRASILRNQKIVGFFGSLMQAETQVWGQNSPQNCEHTNAVPLLDVASVAFLQESHNILERRRISRRVAVAEDGESSIRPLDYKPDSVCVCFWCFLS